MKNLTDTRNRSDALPVCLVHTKYPELEAMIYAVLDGHFRASSEEKPLLIISITDVSAVLSDADDSVFESMERPFTPEALLDAAERVTHAARITGFTADTRTLSAVRGTRSVQLTPTEFRMYSAIIENGDGYISAEDLSHAVWGRFDRNLCTVYISYLRRKLNSAFGDGTLITASGKGYRLQNNSK